MMDVGRHPKIELLTYSEIENVTGYIGNFHVNVRRKARYVDEVACTACERCVADSPEGLVTMKNNLAVVNYDENSLASPIAVERCPTGAIVWLDNKGGYRTGKASKKNLRKEPLPLG